MFKNYQQYAALQYIGDAGITATCVSAVVRLLQFEVQITKASFLTSEDRHAFILEVERCEKIVIKAGFTSGYRGEGPRGLATVLALLDEYEVDIYEYNVSHDIIERINASCLEKSDVKYLENLNSVSPQRWHDYIYNERLATGWDALLQSVFPTILPRAFIDSRLHDLVKVFRKMPDQALMNGYKRLEAIIRERAKLENECGTKLFSKAFSQENSPLTWENIDASELKGRSLIFNAVFQAYRNRRAHNELLPDPLAEHREFMLLNELFMLEKQAIVKIDNEQLLSAED